MSNVTLTVNGRSVAVQCSDRTHLADFLRDHERLTGTHLGCEHGVCGACTVLVDGKPARSCITFAASCNGRSVTTIEGYDDDMLMTDLRDAFTKYHGLQCGFCTPGMLATARDIVTRLPDADEEVIRKELSGNICRCTGYMGIVQAIRSVIEARRRPGASSGDRYGSPTPLKAAGGEFPTFQVDPISLPVERADVATRPGGEIDREADREGWSRVEASFDLSYKADEVWNFMLRLKEVAACLPGATLTNEAPERVEGFVAIKFGPMSARFNGTARLEQDFAARKGVLKGAGKDSLSNSRAAGNVAYTVEERASGGTRVHVDLQYSLQGPLAQFSRSGLVRDFVKRMIVDFGRNVERRMDPSLSEAQRQNLTPQKSNPVGVFLALIWERVKGIFRRD
ncbi:carbon monoxide dehydrogenase [Burkholderia cenocepacia]|nr:carbon monoxide dehydrogenase [Burkholderia cenocepacia]RQZ85425.1 carbon monoxide dehydrogenase [Burkholderia cenocepacia]RRA05965.1 carbon monoxide dehydrogenase [Burkholderia cenocepacia]